MPAFSVLISPAISPFSAVNIFQLTQVSEGEGKKMLFFFLSFFAWAFCCSLSMAPQLLPGEELPLARSKLPGKS